MLDKLKDITFVSLTATSLLDSSGVEWKRYISLCGAVDAEIAIPNLVKENNLRPHQDYIHFSFPTLQENTKINVYYETASYWKEKC